MGVGESGFSYFFFGKFAELIVDFIAVGFDSCLGESNYDASVAAAEIGYFFSQLWFGKFDHGGYTVAGGLEIRDGWSRHRLIISKKAASRKPLIWMIQMHFVSVLLLSRDESRHYSMSRDLSGGYY